MVKINGNKKIWLSGEQIDIVIFELEMDKIRENPRAFVATKKLGLIHQI